VRDDLGVLEIFANQFESKAETAHKICGLAQKWQIGLEGIMFDGNGNTGRDILRALERRYPYGLEPFFGSRPEDWMGPSTLRYQGNVNGPFRPAKEMWMAPFVLNHERMVITLSLVGTLGDESE